MRRAVLMFDGPKRFSKHCEGCSLFESARPSMTCPIWGALYLETSGPRSGFLCREDACIDNETAVADESKRNAIWAELERGR
jgi:hypothetical protein